MEIKSLGTENMIKTLCSLCFLLLVGLTNDIHAQDGLDCQKFKTGKFITYDNGKILTKVVRNDNFQIEYIPETGEEITLKITWINNCSYKLAFVKANDIFYKRNRNSKKPQELIVTILEINGSTYHHESRFTDLPDFVYKAQVMKIE